MVKAKGDEFGICGNCKAVVNVTRDRVCPGCKMPISVKRPDTLVDKVLQVVALILMVAAFVAAVAYFGR